MTSKEMQEKLRAPFPSKDIEWRAQRDGVDKNGNPWLMVLAYVTNRAIQDRLDEVFGIDGWENEFIPGPDGGVLCGLSAWLPYMESDDSTTKLLTKWDGAENTEFEPVKGGLSGSMKRSAVQWGIGRYLYRLETNFAIIHDNGQHQHTIKPDSEKGITSPIYCRWDPPPLPDWALPEDERGKQAPPLLTPLRLL